MNECFEIKTFVAHQLTKTRQRKAAEAPPTSSVAVEDDIVEEMK